jgi:hypothetical protein
MQSLRPADCRQLPTPFHSDNSRMRRWKAVDGFLSIIY